MKPGLYLLLLSTLAVSAQTSSSAKARLQVEDYALTLKRPDPTDGQGYPTLATFRILNTGGSTATQIRVTSNTGKYYRAKNGGDDFTLTAKDAGPDPNGFSLSPGESSQVFTIDGSGFDTTRNEGAGDHEWFGWMRFSYLNSDQTVGSICIRVMGGKHGLSRQPLPCLPSPNDQEPSPGSK